MVSVYCSALTVTDMDSSYISCSVAVVLTSDEEKKMSKYLSAAEL